MLINDVIIDFGLTHGLYGKTTNKTIDANGKIVFTSWCNRHMHIVYVGN